jgi:hypothetical protein
VSGPIDEANEILQAKGYKPAQLAAFATALPTKALLKGPRIVSPFSDSPETVLRVVRDCVRPAAELGTRQITPQELRTCLDQVGTEG